MYLSEKKLKELNFDGNEEYDEKLEEVKSTVNNLDVYLGKSKEGRQKVLGVFINEIEMDDVVSSVDSFIELDMENKDDVWRIIDFNFFQYYYYMGYNNQRNVVFLVSKYLLKMSLIIIPFFM